MTAAAGPTALVTYSVKPRGGVVHTLSLAEALHRSGHPVRVFALGDPAGGFFRPVQAPFTIVPAPPALPTLEERVFASVSALAAGLARHAGGYPVLHTQDCISARAACRVRQARGAAGPVVVRTVHHVDDFTSESLIDCQRQAVIEPDLLLVVSEQWRRQLRQDYGREARVVHNGVDAGRFRRADPGRAAALRARAGAAGRPLILAVGGVEPRKGSDTLIRAVAAIAESGRRPVLAVVGGHSFQDYREYRERALGLAGQLGLRLGEDVVLLGTVDDADVPAWYAAADVLAFPSTKEGWGLAVLEAMSAGLPVVASDLPVFREYLRPGRDALLVRVDDPTALARALLAVLEDPALAARLGAAGRAVAERFTWGRCAAEHLAVYAGLPGGAAGGQGDDGRRRTDGGICRSAAS